MKCAMNFKHPMIPVTVILKPSLLVNALLINSNITLKCITLRKFTYHSFSLRSSERHFILDAWVIMKRKTSVYHIESLIVAYKI
jgi:hypothetical protein